ncbi:MAG TPA: hypothetical protein VH414_03510 [Lichenihabitans sp.]|jgi:hypothetical protein|nr:hypothetical protein [Lichenihabitans sp.]
MSSRTSRKKGRVGEALRLLPLRSGDGDMPRPYINVIFGEAAAC